MVVFAFAFIPAINAGRHGMLVVAIVEPAWLGSASTREGDEVGYSAGGLCHHRSCDLPAMGGAQSCALVPQVKDIKVEERAWGNI